jgi:DNA uptake protein ComE-like DNA-binding protein
MKKLIATTLAAALLSTSVFAQTAPATQQPATPSRPAQPAAQQPAAPARPATPTAQQPAAPAQAQQPARPAAPTTAPAAATTQQQRPGQAQLVNLNTAPENELDKLPQIGPARAKAIIEARTKGGRFKDWNDFVARNVVPKNAEDAIKDKIRF